MTDILRVLGGPKQVCAGVTRRDLLLAGGLGLLGGPAASGLSAATTGIKARAKNVILLYLFGGPSQLETFDPKPDAPLEVRGTIGSIETSLPGCRIAEHLPKTAAIMDRCTVVRSLTHPWNFHGMMWATTNVPESNVPTEETQRIDKHWPYLGSVFEYLRQLEHGPTSVGAVPNNLILPWLLSSKRPAAYHYARPHGSFLGYAYDPLSTEFHGEATKSAVRWSNGPKAEIRDPYLGITAASRFALSEEASLPGEITLDRLDRRKSLLTQFDERLRQLDRGKAGRLYDQQRSLAFSLLNSAALAHAFDLDQEPDKLRDAYGMNLFGQSVLQASRLVESGCRFVTVIWDEYGQLNAGWDTHVDHDNRLKTELLPGFDAAFSTLIHDLEDRGLLDETLVCVMNEMGRTPKIQGEGRGHWGISYSNLFAGGGIRPGNVVGQTDRIAGSVTDRPLSAKDVLATLYHLLGFDPHSTPYTDRQNRPLPLAFGDMIPEMLA